MIWWSAPLFDIVVFPSTPCYPCYPCLYPCYPCLYPCYPCYPWGLVGCVGYDSAHKIGGKGVVFFPDTTQQS